MIFEVSSSFGIRFKVFYNAFLSLIECNTYSKTLHSAKGLFLFVLKL